MTVAYGVFKILCNEEGQPIDYIFVDVDASLVELTGISGNVSAGKKASELEILWQGEDADLMEAYSEAALHGKTREVRVFDAKGERRLRMCIYSPAKEYFITFITDITEEIRQYEEINLRLKNIKFNQEKLNDNYERIDTDANTRLFGPDNLLGSIQHGETRLQSILNILEYKTDSLQDFLDHALDEVIVLTKSKIGFVCFYDEEKKEFVLNTWSKDVYKDCKVIDKPLKYQLEETGIWGETVRQRRPLIDNDFLKANPLKRGVPEGHVQLHKLLAVPIFYEEQIVAVVALANKETDYNQNDILDINLVMNSIWKTVEIRRMHKLICDSEERYRMLFMNMTEGNVLNRLVYAEDGRIVDYEILQVNPAYEYIFGIKKERAEGKLSCEAYESPEPLFLDIYTRVAMTGESEIFEAYFPSIKKFLQISVHSVQGGLFATILEDITERKRFEDLLHSEKEQLRVTLQSIGDGVISTDRYGHVTLINEIAQILTGWTQHEAAGRPLREVLHIYDEEMGMNAGDLIDKVLQTGTIVRMTKHTVLDDRYGIRRIIENSAAPIKDKASDVLGVVIVFRDVTERNRNITEKQRLEAEMQRLSRMHLVGEMAAGIGHELRNPMTTVRGFLQVLLTAETSEKFCKYYRIMIEELDRANSIITEYLNLAKNKAVTLTKVNLNDIIENLSPLIKSDAIMSNHGVEVIIQPISDLLVDEKEIRQLILNLCRNGLEAMDSGGQLTIETYMDGALVVLAIKDAGKGIPPEIYEKIGTPFFTTKDQGVGLGLAICYSIAARNSATIDFSSSVRGTTFYVKFAQKQVVRG